MIFREIVIYGDNERSIGLTKNAESQHRTKHIRDLVNDKELNAAPTSWPTDLRRDPPWLRSKSTGAQ